MYVLIILSILHNFLIFEFKIKDALPVIFWNRFILLRVILYKVYYTNPINSRFTSTAHYIPICFSKSSQITIIQILILNCVVFLRIIVEKARKFRTVSYISSFWRVENLCFWQSVLNITVNNQADKSPYIWGVSRQLSQRVAPEP